MLAVRQSEQPLPSFFKDLGLDTPQQLDAQTVDEVVVPAARRQMAERRQQTLATMVLMGINRVIVKDGEISAETRDALKAELGDVLWYLAQVATELNLTLDEIAEAIRDDDPDDLAKALQDESTDAA